MNVKPSSCKPLEVLIHFVLFFRFCGLLTSCPLACWRLAGAGATLQSRVVCKKDTDTKGLRDTPEPGLLADTVITALRPRQKGSHDFQVHSEILSPKNQWLVEGGGELQGG